MYQVYELLTGKEAAQGNYFNSSYFFKQRQSKDIRPHQDNAYFCLSEPLHCLTFYVPIHRQCKNSGGIYYFERSHHLGEMNHAPEGNIGASMSIIKTQLSDLTNFSVIYPILSPGDIVVHNALVVHGTLPNPRGVLTEAFNFTLASMESYICRSKKEFYEDSLRSFRARFKSETLD